MTNAKAVTIASPLVGEVEKKNFEIKEIALPALEPGKIHVKVIHASVDPYLRGALASAKVGDVMANFCVATVVASQNDQYKVGDLVTGVMPIQTEAVLTPDQFFKIDQSLGFPSSIYVGALGMPCQTAFGTLYCDDKLPLKQGGTILVSGAAGMVGSAVGQLARGRGAARVIGIAGGAEKCALAKEKFGYDECIDYKTFNNDSAALQKALQEAAPEGYDYYYDNVGGFISAAVWPILNENANVAICGQIAHYNEKTPSKLDAWLPHVIYKTITVKGIYVTRYLEQPDFFQRFFSTMIPMLQKKEFLIEETIFHGIDKVPEAFIGLFTGVNTGKLVITFDQN